MFVRGALERASTMTYSSRGPGQSRATLMAEAASLPQAPHLQGQGGPELSQASLPSATQLPEQPSFPSCPLRTLSWMPCRLGTTSTRPTALEGLISCHAPSSAALRMVGSKLRRQPSGGSERGVGVQLSPSESMPEAGPRLPPPSKTLDLLALKPPVTTNPPFQAAGQLYPAAQGAPPLSACLPTC